VELTIYVDQGCFGCSRARQIADEIEQSHDSIDVSVVDLSEGSPLPDEVIAVPAYVLDGRLVSLGNPYLSEITAMIERGLTEERRLRGAEKT
jgi:hypothetical protein